MHRLALGALLSAIVLSLPATVSARPASPLTSNMPAVFPVPQTELTRPERIAIPPSVRLVATASSDRSAVAVAKTALRTAGVTGFKSTRAGLTVFVGRNNYVEGLLGAATAAGLPAGGYVLAAGRALDGRAVIVLDGADRAGQFYAAQTLRQLLAGRQSLQGVVIRDWPSFAMRGVVEGFYGTPWSLSERLSTLDFLAAHKLNLYMYGPKDNVFLRDNWEVPFPVSSLSTIGALVQRAARDHVLLNLVISPGLSICYSSTADQQLLIEKLAAAWNVGVRSFTVALDDISLDRNPCASDAAYGTGAAGIAAAQAALVNAVDFQFIETHPGARRLMAVPTQYSGIDPTAYTEAFSAALAPDVIVQWTGRYGISVVISASDAAAARSIFAHPLLVWDNYFVNDYAPGFLSLGPLERHDSALPDWVLGIAADPMVQPESSRIGLFTVSDYAWNAASYDATRSWKASLNEFAGGDRPAVNSLHAFADANWGSLLNPVQAPALNAAIERFWTAWEAGSLAAAKPLAAQLGALSVAPDVLRARLANQAFLSEAGPWLDATHAWALAAKTALSVLVASREGTSMTSGVKLLTKEVQKARSFSTPSSPVIVAGDALDKFVADAEFAVTAAAGYRTR